MPLLQDTSIYLEIVKINTLIYIYDVDVSAEMAPLSSVQPVQLCTMILHTYLSGLTAPVLTC